ncbi:MAG: 2-oxo acid dehydrogenase subunit E2 [Defluviitaleaceae bacterium]|nr:2-oxo acid dehydrogenase subunit E2 [Defluviitaleaceae bacterium]
MAQAVIMPRQGQSVESCILTKWHKQKGDAVSEGELLFTYETDKAAFDENAKFSGVLLDIFFIEGDDVPCLENVCVIGEAGETFVNAVEVVSAAKPDIILDKKTVMSPRAKSLAKRSGIDPSFAVGTGPGGRIIESDIELLLQKPAAQDANPAKIKKDAETNAAAAQEVKKINVSRETEYIKHSGIRKIIGKSMHASLAAMAQLTLQSSFDATDIMDFRTKIKEKNEALRLPNITLGDMVLFAVSRTLLNHRGLNAHYDDEGMRLFAYVNLGVAVDTERGLMVPTLFDASGMSLAELSNETKKLAEACRSGNISPDQLTGGTFTVTNLGSLGVEAFTPVINPPQTAILGVCSAVERPRTVKGVIGFYPAMGLSLTFDHRAVDGAPAARFLSDLCKYLENFTLNAAVN